MKGEITSLGFILVLISLILSIKIGLDFLIIMLGLLGLGLIIFRKEEDKIEQRKDKK